MAGGLGGLGGFDFGGVLGALGQSLLTSPRENPFQGLPQALQNNAQTREHQAALLAMSTVAEKLGVPKELAASPQAMQLFIQHLNQTKLNQLRQQAAQGASFMPGTDDATSQPALSIPGRTGGLDGPGGLGGATSSAGPTITPKLPAFVDIQGTGPSGKIANLVTQAAQRYDQDPATLVRTAQLESSLNPNAKNPGSSAGGLFQFINSTAKTYGLTNKFDAAASADAGARLMRDNANQLRQALGRDPEPWELYLAHQQGGGGATKLLTNPNASAASLVGADAVRLNGGRAGMTAREFAQIWHKKFGDLPGGNTQTASADVPLPPARPTQLASNDPNMPLPSQAMQRVIDEGAAKGVGQGGAGTGQSGAPLNQVAASTRTPTTPIQTTLPPTPATPPPTGTGDSKTKAWARAEFQRGMNLLAASNGDPVLMKQAEIIMQRAAKYGDPSDIARRVAEAGLTGTPLGRATIAGLDSTIQQALAEQQIPGYEAPATLERKKYLSAEEQRQLQNKLEREKFANTVGQQALEFNQKETAARLEKDKFDYDRYKTDRAYQQQVDQAIQTTTTKDYDAYARQELEQGRTPKSRLDFSVALARAGSPQPEGVEDVERAKGVTTFLNKQAERAPGLAQRSADLDLLSRVINKTATGRGANIRATLDAFAAELGMSSGTFASQKDLIDSITNRIAPSLREPGSGSQSDAELRGFLTAMPHMAGQPGGNELIGSVLRRSSDIDNQRADIAAKWQSGEMKAGEARKQIAALDRSSIYSSPKERELVDRIMGGQPDQQIKPPEKPTGTDTVDTLKALPEGKYGRTPEGNIYQMRNGKLNFIRKD